MTSYSCKLLFKTAETKSSRNLEFLAYKLFGHLGKLLIEIWFVELKNLKHIDTNLVFDLALYYFYLEVLLLISKQ